MQEALSWKMGAVFQVQYKWLFLTYKDSCGFKSEDQQDFPIMSQLQSANMLKHPCFKGSSIKESSGRHPDYQLPIHWSTGQTPSHLFCHALDATRVQQMEKVKGGNRIGNGKNPLVCLVLPLTCRLERSFSFLVPLFPFLSFACATKATYLTIYNCYFYF